jgi:hypothetical protein
MLDNEEMWCPMTYPSQHPDRCFGIDCQWYVQCHDDGVDMTETGGILMGYDCAISVMAKALDGIYRFLLQDAFHKEKLRDADLARFQG